MIAPVLEEIAVDYEGKLKICKMDVDAYSDCTQIRYPRHPHFDLVQ